MMLALSNMFLCSLGALVLAAQAGSLRGGIASWLTGFGGGILLLGATFGPLPLAVDDAQAALLVFLMAALLLAMPRRLRLFLPAGGLLGVLWAEALQTQGFPLTAAWLLVVLSATTALHEGKTRAAFCTPAMMQDVLVILLLVALTAALVPGVLEGWNTARRLSAAEGGASATSEASPALAVVAACFLCGAAFVFFKNHVNERWKIV